MRRALLVSVLLVACRKDSAPPPPLTFAIGTPASANGESIACRRHGADEVFLALGESGLAVHVDMTPGSSVTFLDRVVALPGDVVIADGLARLADGRANEPWMPVNVKVTDVGSGRSTTDRVELRVDRVLGKRFEAVRSGGVRFAGETLEASANKLVYVRPDEDRPPYLVGLVGDGRWRDIDLVAFEKVTHGGGKSCGEVDSIPVIASNVQSHIELWDRRAGKLVETKTFETLGGCGDAGSPPASNADQLRAWLAQKLGH